MGNKVVLTVDDCIAIQEDFFRYADITFCDWIENTHSKDSKYYLKERTPCYFYDRYKAACMIHDIKPQACYEYPFIGCAKGRHSVADIIRCPEARRVLDKVLKEE
jgi:Fe-S-cluster containining protein